MHPPRPASVVDDTDAADAASAAEASDVDGLAERIAQADRRAHVGFASANVRLEGLEPTPHALALAERYVAGEITIGEYVEAVRGDPGPDDGSD